MTRLSAASCTSDWVTLEFQKSDFGDERLSRRVLSICQGLADRFSSNIASAFSDWKQIKAAYRFFANKKVTPEKLLSSHIHETIGRIQRCDRVFLLQDTTYFNFEERSKTDGLDITQRSKYSKESHGLILHNTLAVSEDAEPLGLFNQHFIDRKELKGDNYQEKRKIQHWKSKVDEKESIRWINIVREANRADFGSSEIVHLADRECDFYEFFREAITHKEHFVIRAKSNRSINKKTRREPPSEHLFDFLKGKRAQGKTIIDLQVNDDKKFRQAELSIIYTNISMPPPPNKTANKDGELPILEMSAIMAIERNPPTGADPLCWVLLTDFSIDTLTDAIEKVKWYTIRWQIELFHKVLKSGCAVEKAQLREAQRLKNYITVKSIIAWRLYWLSHVYKLRPCSSCLDILSREEWSILYRKTHKKKPPSEPSTIYEAVIWIAKLGGYIGRKKDPPPGMISIWRGWLRLMNMVEDINDICG